MENLAHYKTAFFTYFSYLETKISQELKKFEIPQELEYALEHLSLDQKTKIVARDVYGVDLGNSKIWSQFSDAFQQAKDLRNKIAHATKLINVEIADINNCFFCIVVINGMNNRLKEFDEIRQFYYPKKKDSLIPENFLVSY